MVLLLYILETLWVFSDWKSKAHHDYSYIKCKAAFLAHASRVVKGDQPTSW